MNKVRLGIIGYGNIGSQHGRSIAAGKTPAVDLTAVVDTDPERLKLAKSVFGEDLKTFDSAEAFTSYVETARACSLYHCTVDVQPGDRLLTLSTCTGTDDNLRLVVMARKVREGENLLDLNMEVMSTYDR